MKRFAASILALGLVAAIGSASAQSSGYDNRGGYYPQPSVDRYGNNYGAQYDYARVVRVDPVIESGYSNRGYGYPTSQQQRCYSRRDGYYAGDDGYNNDYNAGYGGGDGSYGNGGYRNDGYSNRGYGGGSDTARNVATVIGGVIGAALGSQVGGGSARYATAAVGSMVGGIAGRQIYESNNRYQRPAGSGVVTVCDPVPANGGYYPTSDERVAAYDVTYEYAGRRYTTRTNYNPGSTIRVRVDVRPE